MLVTPVVYSLTNWPTLYVDRKHRFSMTSTIARALADLGPLRFRMPVFMPVSSTPESMRSERLTTLGTLAAEIALEIRNPDGHPVAFRFPRIGGGGRREQEQGFGDDS